MLQHIQPFEITKQRETPVRPTNTAQPPIMPTPLSHGHAEELMEIDRILRVAPGIGAMLEEVRKDLSGGRRVDVGRGGMAADRVVRCLIVKRLRELTYEELAFHLEDSGTYRRFCLLGIGSKVPKRSTLHDNLSRVRPETIERLNACILDLAKQTGHDDGSVCRGDCTVVESNVHRPGDSSLLEDGVRVLHRLCKELEGLVGTLSTVVPDRTRRARRRAFQIAMGKVGAKKRKKLYRNLLQATEETLAAAMGVLSETEGWQPARGDDVVARRVAQLREQLEEMLGLVQRVIKQTVARIVRGETVAASEKVLSVFEPHTDLIMKGSREPQFGHKIFVSSGRSGLILDAKVLRGNPADTTLIDDFLQRHIERFGSAPRQTAFDGGFVSKENVAKLKAAGVRDAAFHKKRGVKVEDMATDEATFRSLVRFRAGIEAGISRLKRCFGLRRCLRRGWTAFRAWVQSAVFSANLLQLARLRLAASG